jgi:hypothetical protein
VLVEAADREEEPDIAVAMGVAAFELGNETQADTLRRDADILVKVMLDDGAPRAARREASDALRAHVAFDATCHDDPMAATWWKDHRDTLAYRGHRFAPVN